MNFDLMVGPSRWDDAAAMAAPSLTYSTGIATKLAAI